MCPYVCKKNGESHKAPKVKRISRNATLIFHRQGGLLDIYLGYEEQFVSDRHVNSSI